MAKKIGYIHLYISGSIQILSKSQYRIDISNAGITSKLPLTGSIEKLGSKTIQFQYDDTKVSIDDMLITYQVKAGSNTGFSLAQGSLKASNIGSIDSLGKNSNSIYIKSTIALTESNKKIERQIRIDACNHADSAIQIARYIVDEIKTNSVSLEAEEIRYHLTGKIGDKLKSKHSKFEVGLLEATNRAKRNLIKPNIRKRSKILAYAIWFDQVMTERPWDHKLKISEKLFRGTGVKRPINQESLNSSISISHFHKYKEYDYFYDIWSNIHYGYVGLYSGFDEGTLLNGSKYQQYFQNAKSFKFRSDTTDDNTTMKIGFSLYKKFGRNLKGLTHRDILEILDKTPQNNFPDSKFVHWCYNPNNPD